MLPGFSLGSTPNTAALGSASTGNIHLARTLAVNPDTVASNIYRELFQRKLIIMKNRLTVIESQAL